MISPTWQCFLAELTLWKGCGQTGELSEYFELIKPFALKFDSMLEPVQKHKYLL